MKGQELIETLNKLMEAHNSEMLRVELYIRKEGYKIIKTEPVHAQFRRFLLGGKKFSGVQVKKQK